MNSEFSIAHGDTLALSKSMPAGFFDLVVCSPPYENMRFYDGHQALKGKAWVDWAFVRFMEHYRICKGAVCWVVDCPTRNFRYSGTNFLLLAKLIEAGVSLRKPLIYQRHGRPGSGGPDWFANCYEFVICATHGRLPWSNNTACGWPPKYKPGGAQVNHTKHGKRRSKPYKPPALANPGNIIDCGPGGGGRIGDRRAHLSVAPFPEKLVERFVLSCCPPGGIVLDGFCGSGTTGSVAVKHGRRFVGHETDQKMIPIARERIQDSIAQRDNHAPRPE